MPRIINGQLISLASGTQNIGPLAISDTVNQIVIALDRATSANPLNWSDAQTGVTGEFDLSLDAGSTWQFGGGFTAVGGIATDKSGAEASTTTFSARLLDGVNRQVRFRLAVTNGPLVTHLTVTVT